MKVDSLLAPYLYQHKKLSLPGIGQFVLDEKAVLPDENAKVKMPIEGISFTSKTGTKLDDSLIDYIKNEAGKMRPLAEADLYSFIATAFQYLNIGKPYYFEGIGTLQKNKDNNYTFAAGTMISQKTEEAPEKLTERKQKNIYDDTEASRKGASGNNKLGLIAGIIVTLAIIAGGGYYLYNKNSGNSTTENAVIPVPAHDTSAMVDSSGKKPVSATDSGRNDSASVKPIQTEAPSIAAPVAGNFKFVLETTTSKSRFIRRYAQLKGVSILKEYSNKVGVETKDSTSFKIYTLVPCPAADTARVKDLLNAWYYGKKEMKVKIEQ